MHSQAAKSHAKLNAHQSGLGMSLDVLACMSTSSVLK